MALIILRIFVKVGNLQECEWTGLKFSPDGKSILISTNGSDIKLIDSFQVSFYGSKSSAIVRRVYVNAADTKLILLFRNNTKDIERILLFREQHYRH